MLRTISRVNKSLSRTTVNYHLNPYLNARFVSSHLTKNADGTCVSREFVFDKSMFGTDRFETPELEEKRKLISFETRLARKTKYKFDKNVLKQSFQNANLAYKSPKARSTLPKPFCIFRDYRTLFDPATPLSSYWPYTSDETDYDRQYAQEFSDLLVQIDNDSLSNVMTEGEFLYEAEDFDTMKSKLDNYAMSSSDLYAKSQLKYDELMNTSPTMPPIFSDAPESFTEADLNELSTKYPMPKYTYDALLPCIGYLSRLQVEQVMFIIQMILNPTVPGSYITRHLHELIITNSSLPNPIIGIMMRESMRANRLGMISVLFDCYFRGLCMGILPSHEMMLSYLTSVYTYLKLKPLQKLQDNCQFGFFDTDDDVIGESNVFIQQMNNIWKSEQTQLSSHSIALMIILSGMFKEFTLAEDILTEARRRKALRLDPRIWNAGIQMFANAGLSQDALKVYNDMNLYRIKPNKHTMKILFEVFCKHDNSALATLLYSAVDAKTLVTPVINLIISKLFLQNRNSEDKKNNAITGVDRSHNPPEDFLPMVAHEMVPLFHSAALKFEYQSQIIYSKFIENMPKHKNIPFFDPNTNKHFVTSVPEADLNVLTDDEKWTLHYHIYASEYIRIASPVNVHNSMKSCELVHSDDEGRVGFTGQRRLNAWDKDETPVPPKTPQLNNDIPSTDDFSSALSERNNSSLSQIAYTYDPQAPLYINSEYNPYTNIPVTPLTTNFPNPVAAPGPSLFSHLVDVTQPITVQEMEAFNFCHEVSKTPSDQPYFEQYSSNAQQAFSLLEGLPSFNLHPDTITYTSMMMVMEAEDLNREVIRIFNRMRLSCLGESPYCSYILTSCLYRMGMIELASYICHSIDVRLSYGSTLLALANHAFKSNDVNGLRVLCRNVLTSIPSSNPAPITKLTSPFAYFLTFVLDQLKIANNPHAYQETIDILKFVDQHTDMFKVQHSDLSPRSKTRLLLKGVHAAQKNNKRQDQTFFRSKIQHIDPTFDPNLNRQQNKKATS